MTWNLQDIPPPLRAPSLQPDPSASLAHLLRTGHFHAAAILSAHLLTTLSSATAATPAQRPPPASKVLALFYVRLATLTLINLTHYAAQESKALEDLTSSFYRDPVTNKHIVPWELRVLAVRLQAIGWGDWRRGIEGYYDLARECRAELSAQSNDDRGLDGVVESGDSRQDNSGSEEQRNEIELWQQRLQDLGSRVADALVEMGDLQGAARHLESLKGGGDGKGNRASKGGSRDGQEERINTRLALLYLRIGRVDAARRCVASTAPSRLSR